MTSRFCCIILLSILLVGCTQVPTTVNHPEPYFPENKADLQKTGCVNQDGGRYDCPPESPIGKLGCEFIYQDQLLGGFTPSYSIWNCSSSKEISSDYFVHQSSCLGWRYASDGLVLSTGNAYRLINMSSIDDLKATFAPIDSEAEAMSYLLIASELNLELETGVPVYSFIQSEIANYYLPTIEGTHVEVYDEGYLVNMYSNPDCGCGDHKVYKIDILVKSNGEIKILHRKLAYKFNACVD